MLAYNVKLTDEESDGIASHLLVRTLDQAQRLSRAMNDAQIGLVEVIDQETLDYLNSPEQETDTEEYIASVLKRKN